jgi:hypothetical protein
MTWTSVVGQVRKRAPAGPDGHRFVGTRTAPSDSARAVHTATVGRPPLPRAAVGPAAPVQRDPRLGPNMEDEPLLADASEVRPPRCRLLAAAGELVSGQKGPAGIGCRHREGRRREGTFSIVLAAVHRYDSPRERLLPVFEALPPMFSRIGSTGVPRAPPQRRTPGPWTRPPTTAPGRVHGTRRGPRGQRSAHPCPTTPPVLRRSQPVRGDGPRLNSYVHSHDLLPPRPLEAARHTSTTGKPGSAGESTR